MNVYQKIMLVAGAFWFLWTVEIIFRTQNREAGECTKGEIVTWLVSTAVLTIVAIVLDVLGYLK